MIDTLKNYYKGKRVLVTGGAGCVGSHLVEKLDDLQAEVIALDNFSRAEDNPRNKKEVLKNHPRVKFLKGDVLDFELIKRLIKKNDLVFHLAALPSHRLALLDPRGYASADILGTVNCLEAIRIANRPVKMLFTSTNKVYGKQPPPFKETLPPGPAGPYGQAKLDAEEWCRLYAEFYQLPVVVTRLFHVIGPRSQPDRELSIFVEQILNDQPQIVHGRKINGRFVSCSAGYTNVYEVIEGLLLALMKTKGFDIFNLGSAVETPVIEIARTAQKILKKESRIIEKEMLSHESLHQASDPVKAKKLLGWEAKTPVRKSIQQYIAWRLEIGERADAVYKSGA
jgi:nucleoside-diphosphate-sugar epimerase